MVLLSLLPVGLMQTWAAVEHGYWYARSAEFLHTPLMDTLRWLRVLGDTVFAVGAIAFVVAVADDASYAGPTPLHGARLDATAPRHDAFAVAPRARAYAQLGAPLRVALTTPSSILIALGACYAFATNGPLSSCSGTAARAHSTWMAARGRLDVRRQARPARAAQGSR